MEKVEPFQKPDQLQDLWHEPSNLIETNDTSLSDPTRTAANNEYVRLGSPNSIASSASLPKSPNKSHNLKNIPTVMVSRADDVNDEECVKEEFHRTHQLRRSCPPPSRPNRRRSKTPSTISQRSIVLKPAPPPIRSSSSVPNSLVEKMQSKLHSVRKSWLFSLFQSDTGKSSSSSLSNTKSKPSKWTKADIDFESEFFERQTELTESLVSRRSPLFPATSSPSQLVQSLSDPEMARSASMSPALNNDSVCALDNDCSHDNHGQVVAGQEQHPHSPKSVRPTPPSIQTPQQQHPQQPPSSAPQWTQVVAPSPTPSKQKQTRTEPQSVLEGHSLPLADSEPSSPNTIDSLTTPTSISSFILSPPDNDNHCAPVLRRHQLSVPDSVITKRRTRPQSACLDTYMLRMRNGHLLQFTVDEENKDEECCSIIPSVADYEGVTPISSTGSLESVRPKLKTDRPLSIISNVMTNESSLVNIQAAVPCTIDGNTPQVLDLYWPRRRVSPVGVDADQTAQGLVRQVLTSHVSTKFFQQLWTPTRYVHALAIRLVCTSLNVNDQQWLHPSQNVLQFLQQNQELIAKGWHLEIRIRYFPSDLNQLYHDDVVIFRLLYQQVLADFLALEFNSDTSNTHIDSIIELGCLELRSSNDFLTPQTLDKNSNSESLDLHLYFPSSFVNSVKTKVIRKLIKREFKKIHVLQKRTAIFEFLRLVPKFVDFQKETFHCSIGDSAWSVPIELMVGPKGISYSTNAQASTVSLLKDFTLIEKIQILSHATINRSSVYCEDGAAPTSLTKKILLNVQIKNEEDVLVISCPSFHVAQSVADLFDGYRRLAKDSSDSVWVNFCGENKFSNSTINSNGSSSSVSQKSAENDSSKAEKIKVEAGKAEVEFVMPYISSAIVRDYSTTGRGERKKTNTDSIIHEEDGDYSNLDEFYQELSRTNLRVNEVIGSGQFGDVYKGIYYTTTSNTNNENDAAGNGESIEVAIKISKIGNNEDSTGVRSSFEYFSADQKLLCEAQRMKNLEHSNVIRMIGVCSSSPVYVVMELAKFGELRDFLQKHGSTLEHRLLIEYSMQISSAMSYLEKKQFVHRDIAARNVLVFSFECVKLADFGLSRYIEDSSYYMATNSKLPIKWMAPESINFRRFTTASDVWMFAVCMWEIFMLGKKPFVGVKNVQVIGLIEAGERLSRPPRCPEALYELMLKCWKYEPDKRPTFRYIKKSIRNTHLSELGLVGAIARADQSSRDSTMSTTSSSNHRSSPSSSLSNSQVDMRKNEGVYTFLGSAAKSSATLMDVNKIKVILEEQRRQMDEDSKWLAQNEANWPKAFDSLKSVRSVSDVASSSSTSVYEDAPAGRSETVFLTPSNLNQSGSSFGEASCNSFKSIVSDESANNPSIGTSSSSESNVGDNCNLSLSLKKFFKQNKLADKDMREQMMNQVSCTSANVDRSEDTIYQNTIQVVNSVRSMVKGVRELHPTDYVDLVKNVGQHLRNFVAQIDCALPSLPEESRGNIELSQKKVTSNMNAIVEAMKKTILSADSPLKDLHMQNMLEAAYILIIDTKNLFDMFDEVRLEQLSATSQKEEFTSAFADTTETTVADIFLAESFRSSSAESGQIYENADVPNVVTEKMCTPQTITFQVPSST